MPFASLDTIKPYISKGMHEALNRTGSAIATYIADADVEIRDVTGFPIPESLDGRPDWVDRIAAWLIEYYARALVPAGGGEHDRIADNYKTAITSMRRYRQTDPTQNASKGGGSVDCGAFENQEKW